MPRDLNLVDLRPPVRAAGSALWNRFRIEHALNQVGPWDIIAVTAPLVPLPTSAIDPPVYEFTVPDAPDDGYFRVVWLDTTGDEEVSNALQRRELPSWAPSVQDVADHILQRTVEPGGHFVGNFTDKTRPDRDTVVRFIWKAVQRVESIVTDDPTGNIRDEATELAALRAAMMVELSLFAEQTQTDRSPYRHLEKQWESAVGPVVGGGRGGGGGGDIQGEVRVSVRGGLFSGPEPDFPEVL